MDGAIRFPVAAFYQEYDMRNFAAGEIELPELNGKMNLTKLIGLLKLPELISPNGHEWYQF